MPQLGENGLQQISLAHVPSLSSLSTTPTASFSFSPVWGALEAFTGQLRSALRSVPRGWRSPAGGQGRHRLRSNHESRPVLNRQSDLCCPPNQLCSSPLL